MKNKEIVSDWLERARSDLERVRTGKCSEEILYKISVSMPSNCLRNLSRHLFVHNSKTPCYSGMTYKVSEEGITSAIKGLNEKYELWKEMNEKLSRFDLKKKYKSDFKVGI